MPIQQPQFNGEKLKILLKLYLCDNKKKEKGLSLTEFEKYLGYKNIGRPDVRSLFKYLISYGAMKETDKKYGCRYYYIDFRLLREIRDNQEILNLHKETIWYDIP